MTSPRCVHHMMILGKKKVVRGRSSCVAIVWYALYHQFSEKESFEGRIALSRVESPAVDGMMSVTAITSQPPSLSSSSGKIIPWAGTWLEQT